MRGLGEDCAECAAVERVVLSSRGENANSRDLRYALAVVVQVLK
jgi:hypothetical protein